MGHWIEDVAQEIKIDDLPEGYQAVAAIVGVEAALKLAEHLGGTGYYFPQLESVIRAKRDEMIRREFDGCNHKHLARRFGLTETWIREVLREKTSDKQMRLFEEME